MKKHFKVNSPVVSQPPLALPQHYRAWMVVILFVLGIRFWATLGNALWLPVDLSVAAIAVGLTLLPPVHRRFSSWLDALRSPSIKTRWRTMMGVAAFSIAFLLGMARWQHRDFFPTVHDEFSYMIGAHLLARGHLWMPAHPLADALDSFHLIVQPVYASAYFPGTALLYVPAVWLHVPFWIESLLISGAAAGLMYRVITELIDGVAGLLAVVLLLNLWVFRMLSIMVTSQLPMLALGLLMIWAWLCWRHGSSGKKITPRNNPTDSRDIESSPPPPVWALVLGVVAGLAAITRPVDALCFAVPIGIGILIDLSRHSPRRVSTWLMTGAAIGAGAAPFLALQLISNIGITHHAMQTPFAMYADRDQPNTTWGFHAYDPAARPVSPLPQKQALYSQFIVPEIQAHQPANLQKLWLRSRLPTVFQDSLPNPPLMIFLPLGLLGLICLRRWIVWITLPLFLLFYVFYTWFLAHYVIVLTPAIFLILLLGGRAIERTWPRWRGMIASGFTVLLLALSIVSLPQISGGPDALFDVPLLRAVNARLASLPQVPALIFFRYSPTRHVSDAVTGAPTVAERNVHEEPVYNADVAWPDDAPIVRLHDLGAEQNNKAINYYAQRQPRRAVYRYDESNDSVTYLGIVGSLATQPSR